jgi:N6-adenosine-specific RNA methylase IME4
VAHPPLPLQLYGTIMADPPWPYNNVDGPRAAPDHQPNSWDRDTGAVGSALRYGSMSIEELCKLAVPAAEKAHLYLWTTNSFLVEAHEVARAWGFKPKTLLTWIKIKSDGTPSMRAGYYYRGATEHILFCVRGVCRLKGPPRPTAYFGPRLAHSVKPQSLFDLAVEQSPGPYLEMFARQRRPGWDAWGNEISDPRGPDLFG